MATIKHVAARAGVSFTTVSHVVNGTRPVSDQVRSKVEAAIAELGYVPSGVARSLRVRATGTLGLLLPNASNQYFAELARGIEDHAERISLRGENAVEWGDDDLAVDLALLDDSEREIARWALGVDDVAGQDAIVVVGVRGRE